MSRLSLNQLLWLSLKRNKNIYPPDNEHIPPVEQENHHRLKRIFNKEYVSFQEGTPPKFNSSPLKNDWLEDKPFIFGWQKFQGRAVKLPGV